MNLLALGGGVDSPETVGEGHDWFPDDWELPSTSCKGRGPDTDGLGGTGELILTLGT